MNQQPRTPHCKNPLRVLVFLTLISVYLANPSNSALGKITLTYQTGSQAGKKLSLYSEYHALVIGCSNYTMGWPVLAKPVDDARDVSNMLADMGWSVELLENPTSEGIRAKMNQMIAGPGKDKDSAIFIWFSGHGHTLPEADGLRLGFIVPVDAPNPDTDEIGFMDKAISMRQIETVAKRLQAKHVLMVFDSCFSGAIFQVVRAKPPLYIQDKTAKPVRMFITAGKENETVPDRSVFKEAFIQGVKHKFADINKDGYVTGEELGAYLQEEVFDYSHDAQHPQFGRINNPRLDKGDFVFVSIGPDDVPKKPTASERTSTANQRPNLKQTVYLNQTQWGQWQAARNLEFQLIQQIDKDRWNNLNPLQKAIAWRLLIEELQTDNPYSTEDDRLRSKAQSRFERHEKEIFNALKLPVEPEQKALLWDELLKDMKPDLPGKASDTSHTEKQPGDKHTEKKDAAVLAVDRQFTLYKNGIIYDARTGLEWFQRPVQNVYWHIAKDWAKDLDVGGGDWRLPSIEELETLCNPEDYPENNNISPLFMTYDAHYDLLLPYELIQVWSNEIKQTRHDLPTKSAACFHYGNESPTDFNLFNFYGFTAFAIRRRAVMERPAKDATRVKAFTSRRRAIKTNGRLIDYAGGFLLDTRSGREWVRGPKTPMNWNDARDWAAHLTIDGGHWRLPTIEELEIAEFRENRVPVPYYFPPSMIWSCQTPDGETAWAFDLSDRKKQWINRGEKTDGRGNPSDGNIYGVAIRVDDDHAR